MTTKIHILTKRTPLSKIKTLCNDGWLQIERLKDGRQMIYDDDGLDKNLPGNDEASKLAGFFIYGDCVILEGSAKLTGKGTKKW